MNLSTRVTFSNVFDDASGAEAVVDVGFATYTVHFVNSEIRTRLVSGSPRGAEKKAWPAHAARVAADRWALTDAWKAEHAAMYAAA